MPAMPEHPRDDGPHAALRQLEGEQLSSVEFVRDYLQLRFDGPTLTVTSALEVRAEGHRARMGEPGFRDLLCQRIAETVRFVRVAQGGELLLRFDSGSEISISLRMEDALGGEAVHFFDFEHGEWGVL